MGVGGDSGGGNDGSGDDGRGDGGDGGDRRIQGVGHGGAVPAIATSTRAKFSDFFFRIFEIALHHSVGLTERSPNPPSNFSLGKHGTGNFSFCPQHGRRRGTSCRPGPPVEGPCHGSMESSVLGASHSVDWEDDRECR